VQCIGVLNASFSNISRVSLQHLEVKNEQYENVIRVSQIREKHGWLLTPMGTLRRCRTTGGKSLSGTIHLGSNVTWDWQLSRLRLLTVLRLTSLKETQAY